MSTILVDEIISQSAGPVTINDNLIVTGTNNIRPYKVYTALLAQQNPTDDPQFEVLENTLGATITWTRQGVGDYIATASSPVFTAFKTAVFSQVSTSLGATFPTQIIAGRQSTTIVTVSTVKTNSTGTPIDGAFGLTPIEIRVYP